MARPTATATRVAAVAPDGGRAVAPPAARCRRRHHRAAGSGRDRLADEPRADDPGRLRAARASRATSHNLAAGRRARRPATATGRSGSCSTSRSRSSTPTSTSGSRAAGWELGRAPRRRASPRWPTRRSASSQAAQRPDGYLNTFVQVLAPGARVPGPRVGPRALLLSATSSRRPSPGTVRSATTVSSSSPSVRSTPSSARSARTARDADRRPSRDRDGARRAVPGHRRATVPRPRRARSSSAAATGCSAPAGSAARTGRTTCRSARRRSVAGHAVRQLYLDCGAVDVAVETGDQRAPRRRPAPLARHGRDADVPDRRRSAAATRTRRSATRTSCRPTGPMPRPARRSPASCWPGDSCSRPATPTCADVHRADDLQRRAAGRCRSTGRRSSTSTRSSGGRTAPGPSRATASGAPWYACACCPPNLMRTISSWQQRLATTDDGGIQLHQYAAGEIGARRARRARSGSASTTDYPWDGRSRSRSLETPDATLDARRCACPAGAIRRDARGGPDGDPVSATGGRSSRDPDLAGRRRADADARHAVRA